LKGRKREKKKSGELFPRIRLLTDRVMGKPKRWEKGNGSSNAKKGCLKKNEPRRPFLAVWTGVDRRN